MVVDDRGSCGGASVNGLQGLLLTFVSCKYNDWAGIKCRGHSVEDRRRDHGRFIYDYEVVFVNPVIDVIRMRPVNGYVEGAVNGVSFNVLQEDGVVTLCQQGHGSCNED